MRVTLTLVLVLFGIAVSQVVFAAPLDKTPHLRCSACLAVAEHVGFKMNESAKQRSTFQATHRLDAQNKIKRLDYEESELRAVEILDKFCEDMGKEYALRYCPETNRRLYSNNKTLRHADTYGKSDKQLLRSHKQKLKDICYDITEERDDLIVGMIKRLRKLDELQEQLCYKSLQMCSVDQEKENASLEAERALYAVWKKHEDAKQKKAEERRKKEEEERERKREKEREDRMHKEMEERMHKDMEERRQRDMDQHMKEMQDRLRPDPMHHEMPPLHHDDLHHHDIIPPPVPPVDLEVPVVEPPAAVVDGEAPAEL